MLNLPIAIADGASQHISRVSWGAMCEGTSALAAPDVHPSGDTVQRISPEQQQLDVNSSTSDAMLCSGSGVQAASDESLHGLQAILDIDLHAGRSNNETAAASCGGSGSGADADGTHDVAHHVGGTSNELGFSDKVYWDDRYSRELAPGSSARQHYDWYLWYDNSPLREILREHVPLDRPILQVGVGTSQMQRDMVEDGYSQVVSTDVSAAAVEHLRALHADVPQLSYDVADCRAMPQYGNASFAAVIDKGTLDAIMCGERAEQDAAAMVAECYRVLQPGGVFSEIDLSSCIRAYAQVSYGRPSLRLPYLQPPGLEWVAVIASGVHPQAGGEVPDGKTVVRLPPLLGPYDASEAGILNGIEVDSYYFAYVCRKPL